MKDKKQKKNEQVKSNKMDSFLKKVSKTNTFRNKKGQSVAAHIKELRKETTYSREEKEERSKPKVRSFEDL
tara:strand:+ start:388 stop:600 length:213 start_codon:yes stop_codon:yes gene_type:complete